MQRNTAKKPAGKLKLSFRAHSSNAKENKKEEQGNETQREQINSRPRPKHINNYFKG